MKIKVCGMRSPKNIKAIEALPIDWMGFIFYKKSSRNVEVCHELPDTPLVERVGVFVDESMETILDIQHKFKLDYLQLHGNESPEYCEFLQKRSLSVVKVFSVDNEFDFSKTEVYNSCCDYFLFDTKGEKKGGNGIRFDWSILQKYTGSKKFLLSGGISPNALKDLRNFSHPQLLGIDINSGFEIKPALKDITKIQNFINELK